MADTAEPGDVQGRSLVGTLALAFTAVSVIAFLITLVGVFAGVEGFEEGDDPFLVDIVWLIFSLGALLALVMGGVALFLAGREKERAADRQAGLISIGWFGSALLAVIVITLINA